MKTTIEGFDIRLENITITKVDENGIYHSFIGYNNGQKKINVESRVFDAISMALKLKSSIYINKNTFDENHFDDSP